MAIPKKDSRKITIDGINYRWKVHWRDSKMSTAVELYDNPQSVLQITFPWIPKKDFWDWYEIPAIITPKIIANCIKSALSQGWKPTEKGKTFQFAHQNE